MQQELTAIRRYQARGLIRGLGSLFDLLPEERASNEQWVLLLKYYSTKGIEQDWHALAGDFQRALETYREEYVAGQGKEE